MAIYKCKQLGVCDKADAGEIFDIPAGADQNCPGCGVTLTPMTTSSGSRSKAPLIGAAAAVLVLLAGGGYYFTTGSSTHETPPPAEAIVAPASASARSPEVQQSAATGIAPTEEEIKAQRKESEFKLTSGDAVSAEQAGNKAAANEMLKIAIAKMAQGKLAEAEMDLLAARERDPKQSLVSYNLAVLRLKQGRKDDALKEFEASFMAGFSYFDKMDQDSDLDAMRKDARFNTLVAQYRNKPAAK